MAKLISSKCNPLSVHGIFFDFVQKTVEHQLNYQFQDMGLDQLKNFEAMLFFWLMDVQPSTCLSSDYQYNGQICFSKQV
jgi:hypothetical protein